MSTIIANKNFLASLGIVTPQQFNTTFPDMEDFTEYCDEIGYTWDIEDGELILISPSGKKVDSGLASSTPPEITVTEGNTEYTIEATGSGTIKLYADGTEVSNPCVIERTSESQDITFTATAQQEGKIVSEETEEDVEIPALAATPMPEIDYTAGDASYVITATGQGEIKLYSDGTLVDTGTDSASHTVTRTNSDQTIVFTATAQARGMEISATAEEEITVLALPMSTAPTITATQNAADYTITVTAGQDAVITIDCDGTTMTNPFTVTRGNADATLTVTATATEPNHQTATTVESVTILALPVTATPSLSGVTNDTNCVITATGSGEVKLYADGNLVDTGTDSASYTVNRGNTSQTIVFTATAQESNKQISTTATLNFEVQALPITATPTISYDSTTFTVNVTGNGTVLSYVDGVATQMPHTFTQGASAVTYVVTATAQEIGKQISATATENCLVPAGVIKDYMKLSVINESGNDGNITINIPAQVNTSYATSLSYSKNGSNWIDTAVDSTDQTITIPVNAGDEVYLKGIANQWASSSSGYTYTIITSTANINASGNIMSMLYGDNFENQTSFPSGSQYTFRSLFSDNTHLINANQLELPATTLVSDCYNDMFNGCTSLTTAPALPATTLASQCYINMFGGCHNLTSAPALPATTLAPYCYAGMFDSCFLLTSAPALPATTLANQCYRGMFSSCSSLTSAPELPATTLVSDCYNNMFRNCTSLTTAPELPATTLAARCYQTMFNGCTSLNNITMLATNISASSCLSSWVQNVAATGTFTKSANMTTLPTGNNGIPSGWTVQDYGVVPNYMKLSVLNESGNDGNITITIPAAVDSTKATSMSYSKDGSNWTDTTVDSTAQTITIPVVAGDEVYLKGVAKQWGNSSNSTKINSTANINASGNVLSLFYGDNFENQTTFPAGSEDSMMCFFSSNTHLISAGQLELPSNAPRYCYSYMFSGCTSLTTAPALPATTLGDYCYAFMFRNCSSLTSAPALPATTLADNCYSVMFMNTAITSAPVLPATTLRPSCYGSMFYGCTSLTTAPALPATTLASSCYRYMFQNCTSLTTAPELPATTLAQSCYEGMLQGCSNLNSITMLAENISATNCLSGWVNGVAATGTFTKAASQTSLPTGASGIPTGWTVQDYGVVPNYMKLSVLNESGNDGDITITIPSYIKPAQATSLSYSKDGSNWTDTAVDSTNQTITIPVNAGDEVYLKGIAKQWDESKINSTANINASGNIMSLLYGDNFENQTSFPSESRFAFYSLFKDNTHLVSITNLELPATTLSTSCYQSMFQGCTSLTSAPDLPATTMTQNCYKSMFSGCSSLTSAPALPATTLANNCYYNMFTNCTSLTSAPALPATTLVQECYGSMFSGCSSLTSAPALPATTLTTRCYYQMFQNCSNLNSITMLATNISASSCLSSWVQNVAATGTFTKSANMTILPTGQNGIPSGWTVIDAGLNFNSSYIVLDEGTGDTNAYIKVMDTGVDVTSSCTFTSTDDDNDGNGDVSVSYITSSDVEQEDPDNPGEYIKPSWFVEDGYYASWVGDTSVDGSATLTATYNGESCTTTVDFVAYVEPEPEPDPEEEPEE